MYMARNTAKFNWSQLDRKGLTELLYQLSPKIVKKEIPVAKFHRIIATQMKNGIPIKVTKHSDPKVESGYVYVGGAYYSDDDKDREKCIEISLVYNTNDENIVLTKARFNRLCILFADTVLHEVIHMRQYRRRKFKELPDYASTAEKDEQNQEQIYLGGSDEIDAYGFNIACELVEKFKGDYHLISQYLNEDQSKKKRRSNCWRMYLKAFDHNHNHVIIKRLKSKVMRYLPHAQVGRPYRNKDWIG